MKLCSLVVANFGVKGAIVLSNWTSAVVAVLTSIWNSLPLMTLIQNLGNARVVLFSAAKKAHT